jgi:hypothetical protein
MRNALMFRAGLLASLLFIAIFHLPVKAQTTFRLNHYNTFYDGQHMPILTLSTTYAFNEKIGFATYFYVNGFKENSWGQGLAGISWRPLDGLTLMLLGGIQTNEDALYRFSPIFFFRNNNFSAFGAFEYGGERHRWDIMAFYLAGDFKFGAELIRFYQMFAAGPRVEFTFLKKQPLTVFYSGLWDWDAEKYASMFGIYTTFGGN